MFSNEVLEWFIFPLYHLNYTDLYGDSDMEAAKIDQVCEALVDLGLDLRECLHETDETRKVGN